MNGTPLGLGFGSQFLPGNIKAVTSIETIITLTKNKNLEIIEDLVKICALDIWLRNTDCSINNPNLLLQEVGNKIRLYAIDHSSIFSDLNYLNLPSEIDELPAVGENLIDQNLFSSIYFKYGLFFNKLKKDICKVISSISETQIKVIIEKIPLEWKLTLEEQVIIFNFINKRKTEVENQFNILLQEIGL